MSVQTKTIWTLEKIAILQELWPRREHSATTIAAELGVTRNAVVGKIHRLRGKGIRMDAAPGTRGIRTRKLKLSKAVSKPVSKVSKPPPAPTPVPPPPSAAGQRLQHADLEPHHCRWPFGDPRSEDFYFCGAVIVAGFPFCEQHVREAYKGGDDVERRQVFAEPVRRRRAAEHNAATAGTSFSRPHIYAILAGHHDGFNADGCLRPG